MSAGFGVNVRNGSSRSAAGRRLPYRRRARTDNLVCGRAGQQSGPVLMPAGAVADTGSTDTGEAGPMLRYLRLVVVVGLVAGAAAACIPPPASPGGPSLVVTDTWVTGKNRIWDLAFPPSRAPPVYTENDSGVFYARNSDAAPARAPGALPALA